MTAYDYDIAVIGAGMILRSRAFQSPPKNLLLDSEPTLGGDCLHLGLNESRARERGLKYTDLERGLCRRRPLERPRCTCERGT